MKRAEYKLSYLPRYEKDLNEIIDYIAFKLNNPHSAMKLIDKIENAILQRMNYPKSFEIFQSNRKRKHSYYRIYVDNYIIYYVVIDDIMEIRRILYSGRNAENIIKY